MPTNGINVESQSGVKWLADLHSLDDMVYWTSVPGKLPTITFGEHKGSQWRDVPADYLHWMTRQKDMNVDAIYCANEELARRAAVGADA
jgi:hypothetical protein